jgi:hypothetical protein
MTIYAYSDFFRELSPLKRINNNTEVLEIFARLCKILPIWVNIFTLKSRTIIKVFKFHVFIPKSRHEFC